MELLWVVVLGFQYLGHSRLQLIKLYVPDPCDYYLFASLIAVSLDNSFVLHFPFAQENH